MFEKVQNSLDKLSAYCERVSFKGYDPYDGLNSRLFKAIPFISKSSYARLFWIQVFKKSPINFRVLAGIKKDYNPKALGLFLSGYCNLFKRSTEKGNLTKILFLCDKLLELANKDWSGTCWGYNFDWQAKAFFQPKHTPTVVVTTYVSNALLDAYEITGDQKMLTTARNSCRFILKDLNRTYNDKDNFAFSYSPLDRSVIFNASLLGSQLLSRVYFFTYEKILIEEAKKSVAFCCKYQQEDGSWNYGTYKFHQWIDSFHTGYNLECINDYMKYSGDNEFQENLSRGYNYYLNTFFTKEGKSKYYSNSLYPIDIHSPAQFIITLTKLGKFHEQKLLIDKIMNWTISNMQSEQGYFYYQINKYFSSKIPYIRWAQAWMFYAMSMYLLQTRDNTNGTKK